MTIGHVQALMASLMDSDWLINPSPSDLAAPHARLLYIQHTHRRQDPTYIQTNMLINKAMEWASINTASISSLVTHRRWIITLSVLSVKAELLTTVPEWCWRRSHYTLY